MGDMNIETLQADNRRLMQRIAALEAQIKAAQEQEPIAYCRSDDFENRDDFVVTTKPHELYPVKLYAAPVPAQQSPGEELLNKLLDGVGVDKDASIFEKFEALKCHWYLTARESLQQSPAVPNASMVSLLRKVWKHGFDAENYDDIDFCNDITIAQSDDSEQSLSVPDNNHCSESPRDIGNEIHNIATALSYSGSESIADELRDIAIRLWDIDKSPRITEQDAREIARSEVYLFRRKGLDPFLTCSRESFDELSQNESFEVKILYENALVSAQFPHPRISEQDAIDILKGFSKWEDFAGMVPTPEGFCKSKEGRALLGKLNGVKSE